MQKLPVFICAGLIVKEGKQAEFISAAKEITLLTRKEKGCLRYDFLTDVFDSRKFYFFEEYSDDTAFEEHRTMPYMEPFRNLRAGVVEKYLGVSTLTEIAKR